jgi:RNA polymerase sigma-70 factor (ECF subfamily)
MYPDFLLVQKLKSGNKEAGEQLVKKYYASIYQYCYLRIRHRDLAEDFTQETFMHFFASLKTYVEYGKTKNYIYRIAGNIIKNYYKKKKEVLVDEIPEMLEDRIIDLETKLDIEQAIDNLPEELKEVTILFFFQDIKQSDIAVLLNINLSLVKYRISRAKKLLSGSLEVNRDETIPKGN